MEKVFKPFSGYLALVLAFVGIAGGIACIGNGVGHGESDVRLSLIVPGIILGVIGLFLFKGVMVVNPNHSRVCVFFGKYIGTVKDNGLLWVNPFYVTYKMSLRSQ